MAGLIKILIVSLYYVIFLTFEKWINAGFFLAAFAAGFLGVCLAKKGKKLAIPCKWITIICFLILYAAIVVWVMQMGGLTKTPFEFLLQGIYYFSVWLIVAGTSNLVCFQMEESSVLKEEVKTETTGLYSKMYKGICVAFFALLIPAAAISPYIYARADDHTFGRYAHWAWEQTGSIIEVVKAAFEMIKEAYFGWQGTFSSIFMMAIQPAVFDERAYSLVPVFFIAIIVASSYFFLYTIFIKVLHADKNISKVCIWAYLLLVVQCIPVKQSAYMWYNGAVHYIAAHSVFLCLLTFIIRLQLGKRVWSNLLGAAICAVYVGGANYVTLVGTLLLVLSFFFFILVTRKWKEHKKTASICVVFLIAFLINILAPGNMNKMNYMTQGYEITKAFPLAFIRSIQYMLDEWMHWSIFVFVAVCIPMAWYLVKNTKFSFKYPLVVVGYSWCYMSALFFAPLYTIMVVDVGRFQNVMYLQWILVLLFDLIYVTGWVQRKYPELSKVKASYNGKKYWLAISSFILVAGVLSFIAEPEQYLVTQAIDILQDDNLADYEKDYWENIDLLNNDDPIVTIHNLENRPEFLEVEETEPWNAGLKLFYTKEKVMLEE